MRALIVVLLLLISIGAAVSQEKSLGLTATLPSPYIGPGKQSAFLQLTLFGPRLGRNKRMPMNLCVVLDRSGSMGSERKIEYAREALLSLIHELRGHDRFALVIYDDVVEVAREAGPVEDQQRLRRLIESIRPRGSTNLGGGMIEGFRQAEHFFKKDMINRVILLSDGLANQGITDPAELNRFARRFRDRGISLTTMGMGLEYNENLMSGLAESGGGNYYFIESPRSLASIVHKEFSRLSSLCAYGVRIEVSPADGIRIRDVIGYPWSIKEGRCEIEVGEMYDDERRFVIVELDVPRGVGSRRLVEARLHYEAAEGVMYSDARTIADATFTNDAAMAAKYRIDEVQANVDVARSTRTVDRATRAMDEGRLEDAAAELKSAGEMIMTSSVSGSSGQAGIIVQEQAARIRSFQALAADSAGDNRKAKKSIQFENYRVQKSR